MRPRKLWLAFALSWGCVELCAFLGLVYLDGGWSTYGATQRIAQRLQGQTAMAGGSSERGTEGAPGWAEAKLPHPYFGFASQRLVAAMEPAPRRQKGKVVVGLFGGSVALQVARDGTLEKALSRSFGKPVSLINLSGGGFKQPQQLLVLSYFLSQGGQLDVALSLDGFNEVAMHGARNERDGVHPSYPFSWRSRAAQALTPKMAAALGRLEGTRSRLSETTTLAPWALFPSTQLLLRLRLRGLAARWRSAGETVERSAQAATPSFSGDPYPRLVATWANSTRQMALLCRANGIAFHEFLQPNQYAPVSKPMSDAERKLAYDPDQDVRPGAEHGYPLLLAAGSTLVAEGVAFTDLTGIFGSVTEPVYSDNCCHLNSRGLEILGKAMAKAAAPRKL